MIGTEAARMHSPSARSGWRDRLGWVLTRLWVILLPIQIPLLDSGDEGERSFNLAPSDIVLVIALLVAFSSLRFKPRVWSGWHFALPVVLILNIATVGSLTRYTMLNKISGIVVLFAAYLLLTSMANTIGDVRRLVNTFVLGIALVNLVALVAYLSGTTVWVLGCQTDCLRFQGFLPDANLYGSVLVVAWLLAWGHMGVPKRFVSVPFDLLIHVSLLFGIILTISRSTWIALAVALVAGVVLKGGISPRGWAGVGVVIVGAVVAAGSQFSTFGTLAGRTNTIDSRWLLMEQGVDGFFSNPILGMGLGRFSEQYGQIIHNTPLWIVAELGIIGLVVLVGLLFWFLDRGIAVYRYGGDRVRGLAIGLLLGNIAMLGFSLSVEALYQRHWWFLFAMTAIVHHVSGRSNRHSTRPRLEFRRS